MAAEVRQFTVTTPAGTPIATPLVTSLAFPTREVQHIRVRVPPGPRGNLGWRIAMAGNQVIPVNTGAWIIGDDETLDWDLEDLPNTGAWQLQSYNLGKLPHSVYITFNLTLVGGPSNLLIPRPLSVTA